MRRGLSPRTEVKLENWFVDKGRLLLTCVTGLVVVRAAAKYPNWQPHQIHGVKDTDADMITGRSLVFLLRSLIKQTGLQLL